MSILKLCARLNRCDPIGNPSGATRATLFRRLKYGGRKGRRAAARWRAANWGTFSTSAPTAADGKMLAMMQGVADTLVQTAGPSLEELLETFDRISEGADGMLRKAIARDGFYRVPGGVITLDASGAWWLTPDAKVDVEIDYYYSAGYGPPKDGAP